MSANKILIYLLRRDLRVSDNPIIHRLATSSDHGFTHLLPVYVFPAHQIEVSGFIKDGSESPFPEARGVVSGFWRCGPHRAKFIGQSVWDMKESLEKLGSGLALRVGAYADVLKYIMEGLQKKDYQIGAVWITADEGVEEKRDENAISSVCSDAGINFQVIADEKYFIDDRDVKLDTPKDLPDVFTTYRKQNEDLRDRPRDSLPTPAKSSLPGFPSESDVPAQEAPFEIPSSADELEKALVAPVENFISTQRPFPEGAASAHPLLGGETKALDRLDHIIKSGAAFNYKTSRNGLIGTDFSTKLSAYLALGCLTARQIHKELVAYEDGKDEQYASAQGYGEGENEGTKGVRFELLWRDYMRLCTRKFTYKLFRLSGFREDTAPKWKTANKMMAKKDQAQSPEDVDKILQRFFEGTTGMGFIDASQREIIHTGYTSNRARQNVASFLAKHLGIDWRYGAEWYEMLLIDYDVSSNWANWQYVAGVGNDPRGEARIFNPVKQAFDYDKEGKYVRCWVPELRPLEKLENVFQAWTTPKEDWERFGLTGLDMAEDPIKKIDFSVDGKFKNTKRPFDRRRRDGRIRTNGNGNSSGSGSGSQEPNNASDGTQNQPADGQQRQFPQDAPRSPRGGIRGGRGGRGGGGGGGGGGYRGRGYGGGPRGGAYRGGFGQQSGQIPSRPAQFDASNPAT